MRKLFTLALILSAISGYSQRYAKVYIWKITPDTVQQGDSITVNFKYDEPQQTPYIDSTFMQVYDGINSPIVWQDNWINLKNYPKVAVGINDSVCQVRIKVPITTRAGVCKLYGRGGDYMEFVVKAKVATAVINNRNTGKIISTRYFGLNGNEYTEPISNQLMIKIEQHEDGSYNTTKSVTVF